MRVAGMRRCNTLFVSTKEQSMVRMIRGLMAIAIGIGVAAPVASIAEPITGTGNFYVMTNDASRNEVIAYKRVGYGEFIESHRYYTGGRGSGGVNDPLGSQGSLTLSADHALLFAANAGSGTVSVFRVFGGILLLTDTEPSGGSEPVAVAQRQNLVYVLNAAGSGSVVGFYLGNNGRLQQIKDSTMYLSAAGTGGASITISPDGQFLAVTEKVANSIDIFRIEGNGKLAPIVVNQSADPGTFAALFAPNGKLIVSETGPAGAVNASTISSYSVLPDGKVSAISQGVPTFGMANCWNAITPDGKRVYVSNAASSTISGFTIGKDGSLTPIGSTVVGSNPQGSGNLDIAVSGDGKFVYTLNSAGGTVGVFGVQADGTLSNLGEIEGLPKSVGYNGIAAF
jgi:6-phosphogluconolactonase (cycloisomerase 2 family)